MPKITQNKLYTLILAAGQAQRFGAAKQLARLGGISVIERAITLANELTPTRCLSVIGAYAEQMYSELSRIGCPFIYNTKWREGMGTSIAAGVSALPSDAQGVLIVNADQVMLSASDLGRLIKASAANPDLIIASEFCQTIGPPVIFPASLFMQLTQLSGARGARELIRNSSTAPVLVNIENAQFDIDTKENLRQFEVALASREHDSRNAHN